LIAARDLRNLQEFTASELVNMAKVHNWNVVPQREAPSDVRELVKCFIGTNPLEFEGYVLCDSRFNRVKVSSPQYLVTGKFLSFLQV
jgi:hypothetical protein